MPSKHKHSSQTAANSQLAVEDDAVSSQAKCQKPMNPFGSEPSPPAGEFYKKINSAFT